MHPPKPRPLTAQRYAFLVLSGASSLTVAGAVSALQQANRVLGKPVFDWVIASVDGNSVTAGDGLGIASGCAASQMGPADIVFVCSGDNADALATPDCLGLVRRLAAHYPAMGGLGSGALLLARAGLLEGHQASIDLDWQYATQQLFPQVLLCDRVFSIDRHRYTAAGGLSSLHLMLQLVAQRHGAKLAADVAEALGVDYTKGVHDSHRVPMAMRVGSNQKRLIEVEELMQANLEEPLTLDEIGRLVGVSKRQVERLFRRYLGVNPARHYMEIRLREARALIRRTALPMVDIAAACGFGTAAYFSRCYRERYGCPPMRERLGVMETSNVPEPDSALDTIEPGDLRSMGVSFSEQERRLTAQLNSSSLVIAHLRSVSPPLGKLTVAGTRALSL